MSVAIPGVSRYGRTHTFALIERITLASTVAGDLPEWRSHSGYRQLAGCPHRSWAAGAVVGVSEPGPGLRPARDPPAVPDRSPRAARLPAGLPGFLSVGRRLASPIAAAAATVRMASIAVRSHACVWFGVARASHCWTTA